jgi:hypothetical protein
VATKKPRGRPTSDYQVLYQGLLHDLHHGVRADSATILGVLSLQLGPEEKLYLIESFIIELERKTRIISAKYYALNP